MKISVTKKLAPHIETLGLLYFCAQFDENIFSMEEELSKLGTNISDEGIDLIKKYVTIFHSNMKISKDYKILFDESDENFLMFLVKIFNMNESGVKKIGLLGEAEADLIIKESINMLVNENSKSDNLGIIDKVSNCNFSNSTKWKLILFLNNPLKYIKMVLNLIEENINAYNKAEKELQDEIECLLIQFHTSVNNESNETIKKLNSDIVDGMTIVPTMCMPLMLLLIDDFCYYGLLYDKTVNIGQELCSKATLIPQIKALSDGSKLEILHLLKGASRYNLEIAEQLKLTPPTVTHHMRVLLASGFVYVTRKNGKIYYHIDSGQIEKFLHSMRAYLL